MVLRALVLSGLALAVAAPAARAAAWPHVRQWADLVDPTDPDSPTYAEAYPAFVRATAPLWIADGTRLDCADFSITLICEYAARHGLPLSLRYWGANGTVLEARSTSPAFASKEQYARFARTWINAMMLAKLNTTAIAYDEWTSGDHVFMDWNQSEVEPNYPGRTVWHTYVVGVPDEVVYYGSMNDGEPTTIYEGRAPETLARLREHPDRYLAGPRRWNVLKFRPGREVPAAAIAPLDARRFAAVNDTPVRLGPGTSRAVEARIARGTEMHVTGRWRAWLRVDGADGWAWVHESLLAETAPAAETFARVAVASANVRVGPGVVNPVIERLSSGARVKVIAASGSWLRIATPATLRTPDLERWIAASLVAIDAAPAPAHGAGTVTAASLNVRAGPGTSYAILTRVAAGTGLMILEERAGWLRVDWPGAPAAPELWCSGSYVVRAP